MKTLYFLHNFLETVHGVFNRRSDAEVMIVQHLTSSGVIGELNHIIDFDKLPQEHEFFIDKVTYDENNKIISVNDEDPDCDGLADFYTERYPYQEI